MKTGLYLLAAFVLLNACSPNMKTTGSWVNQDKQIYQNKNYKKIFIAVITSDLELRKKLETELSNSAQKMGYQTIQSLDKFNPGKMPTKEEAFEIIKTTGADLIFSTAVVDEKSESRYVQSTGFTPRFYGGYRGYYFGASAYYQPGYYTTDKTYFLESNLFDVRSESLIWSAQSQVYNPTDINNSSKHYTELMLKQLKKNGIIPADIKN